MGLSLSRAAIAAALLDTTTTLRPAPRGVRVRGADGALRILLATDLAHGLTDADSTIAQLQRLGTVMVDVVHVVPPGRRDPGLAERLDQVMGAEAVLVRRRLLEDEAPAEGLARLCANGNFDLAMVPARHHAFGSWWRPSVRAAILRQSAVPVWTTGAGAVPAHPIRRIGCVVTLESDGDRHLAVAAELATRLGAALHLLHVVPAIDDGTIAAAHDRRPLTPREARERVAALRHPGAFEILLGEGSPRRELARLADAAGLDLLCVAAERASQGDRLSPALRAVRCPMLYLEGSGRILPAWWRPEATISISPGPH